MKPPNSDINLFPEEVLEKIFDLVTNHKDRNVVSSVCRTWYKVERESRRVVFIGNCYAISPERVMSRFPAMRSLVLKGKPHLADFDFMPTEWGAVLDPWIKALAKGCPGLEELRVKRMVVTDVCLEVLSKGFVNLRSLVLVSCEGFSTRGFAAVAANCRYLRELDLHENEVEDPNGHWLSCFSESYASLESLKFSCLKGAVNSAALVNLVVKSPNLRTLRLSRGVSFETLHKILIKAPHLVDLGIASFVGNWNSEIFHKLKNVISKNVTIRSLSGFFDVFPRCLPAIYPLCVNLTSLNLRNAPHIYGYDLMKLIRLCKKLQCLWILDKISDKGLGIVAAACKDLEELRVFPSDPEVAGHATVTEEGLVAVSHGCPKMNSILYFCHQMTNAALITVAKNCPNLINFRLYIMDHKKPDPATMQPLDEGYGEIVQSCKRLRRFSISGLLTDRVFLYIGMYAEQLEMLSIAFAGDSDNAMCYLLRGCRKLKKLEIRDCPFGDKGLLMDMEKCETIRSLWMSSCDVTIGGCKRLARDFPSLNVEIIAENEMETIDDDDDIQKVSKMFLYRTLIGPRKDAPDFVCTL